jgi:hypothetical protein
MYRHGQTHKTMENVTEEVIYVYKNSLQMHKL